MKILICDDERQYLDALSAYVRAYMEERLIKYSIVSAASPKEVLDGDMSFDLAFLDIQMEDLDGISLAKELRARNSKIAIFFVTNHDEYQDDAMDVNAFRFFSKPFDVKRLYSGLDKAMEYTTGRMWTSSSTGTPPSSGCSLTTFSTSPDPIERLF